MSQPRVPLSPTLLDEQELSCLIDLRLWQEATVETSLAEAYFELDDNQDLVPTEYSSLRRDEVERLRRAFQEEQRQSRERLKPRQAEPLALPFYTSALKPGPAEGGPAEGGPAEGGALEKGIVLVEPSAEDGLLPSTAVDRRICYRLEDEAPVPRVAARFEPCPHCGCWPDEALVRREPPKPSRVWTSLTQWWRGLRSAGR